MEYDTTKQTNMLYYGFAEFTSMDFARIHGFARHFP